MEISVADLKPFDLAGNTGHTDSQGVACELSGYLCDLADKSDPRPHQIHLTEVEPFPVEHSFNGSSNQTYANPLVE